MFQNNMTGRHFTIMRDVIVDHDDVHLMPLQAEKMESRRFIGWSGVSWSTT
jgi:hypothetical protein